MRAYLRHILAAAALTFGAVQPASADFLYDVKINVSIVIGGGPVTDTQFIEPSILMSSTQVSSFTSNSGTGGMVTLLSLDPVSSGDCVTPVIGTFAGPCVAADFSGSPIGIGALGAAMPVFTSIGTFGSGVVTVTITQIASVPEPSPLWLLLAAFVPFVFTRIRSVRVYTPSR